MKLQQMMAEMATVKQQLERNRPFDSQKTDLEKRLQDSEETCNALRKELCAAQEKLQALEQSLKGKEEIEIQNESLTKRLQQVTEEAAETEELKEKLVANESIVMNNDEMVSLRVCCVDFVKLYGCEYHPF